MDDVTVSAAMFLMFSSPISGSPLIGAAPSARDMQRVAEVANLLEQRFGRSGTVTPPAVDANGRIDLETALAYGKELEPLALFWLEEAEKPLDCDLQAGLARHCKVPLATGENLFSVQDTTNLPRHAGMRLKWIPCRWIPLCRTAWWSTLTCSRK